MNGEPDPERSHHVEFVAGFQRRQPVCAAADAFVEKLDAAVLAVDPVNALRAPQPQLAGVRGGAEQIEKLARRSEEHTSELQSLRHLVCRLLLEKKKKRIIDD